MKKGWLKWQRANRNKTIPILYFPVIQLLGINIKDLIYSVDYQVEAMQTIVDNCPISASVSMMDLSVEAEAFGSKIRFFDYDVPTVVGKLIEEEEDVEKLVVPKVGSKRDGIYLTAISKASKLITDRPILGGIIGPFSLAGRLMDMTEIMVNCYINPGLVHKTLEKVSEYLKKYMLGFKRAGAKGIIMAEPAAGLLSPELCEEFSSKYVREIFDEVRDDNFIIIYHNCGNVVPLVETIISVDADIYHFGNSIDIEQMLKLMPSDKLIMGNIDPAGLFKNGTVRSIQDATTKLLERCNHYENFLISSGCDIPPLSSWDNIMAYFNAIEKFYQKI
ncbi:MAG: uroporphyrinogen decarboxylase family protein [Bacilli bacterium]|nr:uroporphyrinogen decarboxylase family protein [Bacilli bacterium]